MVALSVMPDASDARPLLAVREATLRWRQGSRIVTAVERISFDLEAGERIVLLGPSGCGKSTLLKAIGGFVPTAEGAIELQGERIRGPGPDRLPVFQEFEQLLPWRTVLGNVAWPLRAARRVADKAEARERAEQALAQVGLSAFRDAYPHALSGGMKQRVAIARALALQPKLLLMDEPFAALDALTRRKLQRELLDLCASAGLTLLFVTHSIDEALLLGTRVLALSAHPGRLVADVSIGPNGVPRGSAQFAQLERKFESLLEPEGQHARLDA